MIASEILKEQKLRKLPVNLKTMVDILVCIHLYTLHHLSAFPLAVGSSVDSE